MFGFPLSSFAGSTGLPALVWQEPVAGFAIFGIFGIFGIFWIFWIFGIFGILGILWIVMFVCIFWDIRAWLAG